jgi:hypothetical protein
LKPRVKRSYSNQRNLLISGPYNNQEGSPESGDPACFLVAQRAIKKKPQTSYFHLDFLLYTFYSIFILFSPSDSACWPELARAQAHRRAPNDRQPDNRRGSHPGREQRTNHTPLDGSPWSSSCGREAFHQMEHNGRSSATEHRCAPVQCTDWPVLERFRLGGVLGQVWRREAGRSTLLAESRSAR